MRVVDRKLVLASSSPWRKALLERLGFAFQAISAEIDESPLVNEAPAALVARLSREKALAVGKSYTNHAKDEQVSVIGSDQVAVADNRIIGKPNSHINAVEQLRSFSGKSVVFLTGLALFNVATGECQTDVIPYEVSFRELTDTQIDSYLRKEQPYQCAGSFKSEGLGIALFSSMRGDDPTALIGLPLIRLVSMLAHDGFDVLAHGSR